MCSNITIWTSLAGLIRWPRRISTPIITWIITTGTSTCCTCGKYRPEVNWASIGKIHRLLIMIRPAKTTSMISRTRFMYQKTITSRWRYCTISITRLCGGIKKLRHNGQYLITPKRLSTSRWRNQMILCLLHMSLHTNCNCWYLRPYFPATD